MIKPLTFSGSTTLPVTRFDEWDDTYFTQTGHFEYYTPQNKHAQAQFEHLYGYPIDIDKVWEDREKHQNEEGSNYSQGG